MNIEAIKFEIKEIESAIGNLNSQLKEYNKHVSRTNSEIQKLRNRRTQLNNELEKFEQEQFKFELFQKNNVIASPKFEECFVIASKLANEKNGYVDKRDIEKFFSTIASLIK